MIAAEIIGQVLDAGGQIAVDGGDLVLTAPRPLPADLLDTLKAHKPAILAALAAPAVTEESIDADRQGWGAMTTAALLQAAEAAGMAIRVDGDALAYEIYSGDPQACGTRFVVGRRRSWRTPMPWIQGGAS